MWMFWIGYAAGIGTIFAIGELGTLYGKLRSRDKAR